MKLKYILSIVVALGVSSLSAKENIGQSSTVAGKTDANRGLSADCNPATAQVDLAINNVRTTILGGGDMWWDLNNAKYEIPKLPEGSTEQPKHSMFAGSLWIGGVDAGGQLKVAAMTYRQTGNDFWPGPLNTATADISADECDKWDTHFKASLSDVESHIKWLEDPTSYPDYTTPSSLTEWPAHGSSIEGQDYFLAPFFDADGDGNYSPDAGDYPDYNATGDRGCDAQLFGDETIWWVFNDKGNIHTETGAEAIGLEIHAQAFGFKTTDEINNMTFYQYKIYNRSTFTLTNTYFGQWVDPDLGNYNDDYVGCDVERGLGYCFNGDQDDEGARGYGENPPAIGVDFFQGPLADADDNIDNDRDGIVDEEGEQIIMSKFVYYNNDFSVTGNPETGTHIYNYLRGIFKDGTEMEYGGTGHSPSGTTTGITCDFMFPGDSDPDYVGTNGQAVASWTESEVGNDPADRRFLQSAGAFTLEPGAVNTITTGVVWARASQGGPAASVELMRQADDKAQALFDNCFKVLDGPDAPDMNVIELDREIILTLENPETSNNFNEAYAEFDPFINAAAGNNFQDTVFSFQGYQIYQFADATVSITDIEDPDKVRLVAQVDVQDEIGDLINYEFDAEVGVDVAKLKVQAANAGISNSFQVTKDLFASGDDKLVNYKQYYYTVIAYGHNNYKTFNPNDGSALDGQRRPYLVGRKNIQTYTVTPRDPRVANGGTNIQSTYGTQPSISRVSGYGNGGLQLNFTDETVDAIVAGTVSDLEYTNDGAPIDVRVIDPTAVPLGDFTFEILDSTANDSIKDGYWRLINETDNDTVYASIAIGEQNDQIISKWGLAVNVNAVNDPGSVLAENNGFIAATMEFEDESKPWLTGWNDIDGNSYYNWIRAGELDNDDDAIANFNDYLGVDNDQVYEGVLEGLISPYRLASNDLFGPAVSNDQTLNNLADLNSIKLVITSDKSKWTRSPVIELSDDAGAAIGGAGKFDLRESPSVDKDGNADGTGNGMGWFPGYAIDLETGDRLNIMFGENSFFAADNGNDMIWNPSDRIATNIGDTRLGGMHSVYILRNGANDNQFPTTTTIPAYDEAQALYGLMEDGVSSSDLRSIVPNITWVFGFPLQDRRYDYLATDVEINIHVNNPYSAEYVAGGTVSSGSFTGDMPVYRFNTADIMAETGNDSVAVDVLEKINIVPNPYYAFSEYESNQLDNRVRLTNLPEACTIRIFALNGTLIRTFDKDDNTAFLDWDLKNQANIPVASGMYIIHVEVEGVGEKVLKWFGVMRPVDLDTF